MRAVTACEVAGTGDLRIDPHHYKLRGLIDPLVEDMQHRHTIGDPPFCNVRNGENIGVGYYIRDEEPSDVVYASVGAISQFTLRIKSCTSLRVGSGGLSESYVEAVEAKPDEVWMTRSGTPGIAWAPESFLRNEVESRLIPSGFLIRWTCDRKVVLPMYTAAILNHPIWRIWTSSLAAGKRQRNLSQDHLSLVGVPILQMNVQQRLSDEYLDTLSTVDRIVNQEPMLEGICDAVLSDWTALSPPEVRQSIGVTEAIDLGQLCDSSHLRLDHRNLRRDLRDLVRYARQHEGFPLGSYVSAVVRNGHPTTLAVDDGEAPRVIATGTLQFGRVQEQLTKQGQYGERQTDVRRHAHVGDVLVAMDGEGSIGKAAVFFGNYEAVCDSHVAIFRLREPALADAFACFINSSLGQAQIKRLISGSTGQLQISSDDILSLWIPNTVSENAVVIGQAYNKLLDELEGTTAKARRTICNYSASVSSRPLKKSPLDPVCGT